MLLKIRRTRVRYATMVQSAMLGMNLVLPLHLTGIVQISSFEPNYPPGMATFKPLLALKSSTLKSLAVSLGVNSTGTKSQLASQIVSACRETIPFFERPMLEGQPSCERTSESGLDLALGAEGGVGKRERDKRKDKRVLSIDMGIRNLAMCVLEVQDPGLRKSGTRRRKGKVTESLPKVLAWERVTVAKKPEVEEPPAIPEESIAANKNKRPPSRRKKVTQVPYPEGELGVPSAEAISTDKIRSKKRKKLIELPPEGEEKLLEQDVSSEQTTAKSRSRPGKRKRVVEVIEEPPPEKEQRVWERENPLQKKGNEKTEKEEVPPEGEKRALGQEQVSPEQTAPKSESGLGEGKAAEVPEVLEESRKGRGVLEKGGNPSGDEMMEVPEVMKISPENEQRVIEEKEPPEERAPEVTEVTEAPYSSGEQEILNPKRSRSEEATIPDGKRRGRKVTETPSPEEEERKAPKQEEISPGETIPGIKGRPRRKERVAEVTEAQSPKELVSPTPVPDADLALGELPKKGGIVGKKPKKKAESFEPSVYALLANNFVRHTLDRFSPLDAILIERQRYRSGSSAAIQEWTVRVNTLEAMLHAVFCCLHGEKSPVAEGVSPSKVTRFWVDRVGEKFLEVQKKPERRKKKEVLGEKLGEELGVEGVEVVIEREKTYRKTKLAKVSLVKEWLRSGGVVKVGKDAKGVAADFEPVKGRRKSERVSGGKLDDLADCLLQGMAWIRWEENRRRFSEGKLIPEYIPYANSKS